MDFSIMVIVTDVEAAEAAETVAEAAFLTSISFLQRWRELDLLSYQYPTLMRRSIAVRYRKALSKREDWYKMG